MRWALAAASLVVVANGVVLISARRERALVAAFTTIDVCADQLIGGGTSDEPPVLLLHLAQDSILTPEGLDADGLRALGFGEMAVNAAGRERDSTYRWPRPRPAWVRLRQRHDSLAQWEAVEVAPLDRGLSPDSTSIVIRGMVGLQERREAPPPDKTAGHQHAPDGGDPNRGVLQPAVIELIPSRLHLDRGQIAALRGAIGDTTGCAVKGRVVIASGVRGGIWVESVR